MELKINASPRDLTKKKVKTLRKEGLVPAAIFGFQGNSNVQVNQIEAKKAFIEAGHSSVVTLDLGGNSHNVLFDDIQFNPVTRDFTHISFREVNMNEEITAVVPFELTGEEESPAVKDEDSLIILAIPEVELRGLPKNIPSEITIDVSSFHTGDTLTLSDIKLPEGLEVVHKDQLEEVFVTTASAVQEEIVEMKSIEEVQAEAASEESAEKVEDAEEAAKK